MASGKVLFLAAVSGLALCCERSTPSGTTESCRDTPRSVEEDGVLFNCELDQGATVVLTCAHGAETRRWEYPSLADLVNEAATPNRPRWRVRTTSSGVLLDSFTTTVRSLELDAQGRVSRRLRTTQSSFGTFVLDDTVYSQWDGRGRPTRGVQTSGDLTEPVSLSYDDAARRVETSRGEHAVVDANGNLLDEVEVFGLGPDPFRRERTYRTTATERVCLP